uniref:Reverse transcriptase zinc-binding domain-containing protein n=1 Tax=Aegilops tauschii subsp. strangulata TaxID=200361 RepID=A0A453N8D0_AEGTS
QHLFFTCPVARVVWRSIGVVLGTDKCPDNYWQFFAWCYSFFQEGKNSIRLDLQPLAGQSGSLAIRLLLRKKQIKSPSEFSMCSFLMYWTWLRKGDDTDKLRSGAE